MNTETPLYYNAFTRQDIIDATNKVLARIGPRYPVEKLERKLMRKQNLPLFLLTTRRGGEVLVLLDDQNGRKETFSIKGVYRVMKKQSCYTIGPTGLAEAGLKTLVSPGDSDDIFVASDHKIKRYWEKHLEHAESDPRLHASMKFASQCTDFMGAIRLIA
jgi:hypothetical protein